MSDDNQLEAFTTFVVIHNSTIARNRIHEIHLIVLFVLLPIVKRYILSNSLAQTLNILSVQICGWFIKSENTTVHAESFRESHPDNKASKHLKSKQTLNLSNHNIQTQ